MAGHQAPVAAVGRGRAFGLGVGHVGIGPDLADLRTHVGHGGDGTGAQVELENLHAQAIGGQEVQAVRVGGMPEGFGVAGQPCGVAGEVVEHLQRLARVGIEHVPEAGRVFEQEAAAVGVEGLAAGIVVAQVGCLFRLLAGLVVGHAHDAAAEGGILRGNQIVWARAIGYGRDCRAGNERVDAGQDGVAELRAAGLRGGCGARAGAGGGQVLSWLGSAAGERCVAGAGLLAGGGALPVTAGAIAGAVCVRATARTVSTASRACAGMVCAVTGTMAGVVSRSGTAAAGFADATAARLVLFGGERAGAMTGASTTGRKADTQGKKERRARDGTLVTKRKDAETGHHRGRQKASGSGNGSDHHSLCIRSVHYDSLRLT